MFRRFLFQLIQFVLKLSGLIFNPLNNWVFSKIYDGDAETVPKVENEVLLQSATQLAKKIRSREVGCLIPCYKLCPIQQLRLYGDRILV